MVHKHPRVYNILGLLALGLAGVAGYNWRLWRRDRALADWLRSERAPIPALSRAPQVSALVAAWNEAEQIDAHIQSFLALAYPNVELVICAGGADDTLARARRYAGERVTVLEQRSGEGKQKALARCYECAAGELIYLTDADCRFDDEALARLVAPIVNEGEQVTTGGSRPLDEQAGQLLPFYVWSTEVFSAAHYPKYLDGLLGRNALLTRSAIERSGKLQYEAATGTDYHLARRLIAEDIAIRNVTESIVETIYPETFGLYWRKQSRWIRNLLLYGGQYQAYHQVASTLRSAALGAGMLLLPFFSIGLGFGPGTLWLILVFHSFCAKVRYLRFAARLYRQQISSKHTIALFPITLFEFVIWVTPVLQLLSEKQRKQW